MDVLEEAKIEIAGIAGTSAGALASAMLLGGQSRDAIVERFESFTATTLYRELRRLYAAYMSRAKRARHAATYFRQSGLSFMSDTEMSAVSDALYSDFIEYFVGPDRDISSLARPFAACATDIVEGRPAFFMRGPLHHALRASCAVPGLFPPQRDGERLLVDGSTVTEVPISAALGLRLSSPVLGVYLETPTRKVENFATSAEVLTRTAALVQTALVREQLRTAPVVLNVPVRDGGWLDFRRARETRQVGEVVTRMSLQRLLEDLDRARAERRRPEPAPEMG
jgi:NTE family protein